jgi:hypothetical protein
MAIDSTMDDIVKAGRKAEASALSAKQAPPADRSMASVYSQFVSENKAGWDQGQQEASNALVCIGVQVRGWGVEGHGGEVDAGGGGGRLKLAVCVVCSCWQW